MRAIAIVSVVLYHAAGGFRVRSLGAQDAVHSDGSASLLDTVLKTGEYGVPLFFAISGFILALPFATHFLSGGKRIQLKKYFWRRVTRLEPPYFLVLIVVFAKLAFVSGSFEALPQLLASMFYVHNVVYGEPSFLGIAWSLEVEVQFYLAMPLLAFVFAIKSAMVRRVLLAGSILGFSLAFGVEKPIAGLMLHHHAAYFLVGLLLVEFHIEGWLSPPVPESNADRLALPRLAWDSAALVCLLMVFGVKALGWAPVVTTPWLILAGYVAVFRSGFVRSFFRWTPIVVLGGMCYSIYLWHTIFLQTFGVAWFKLLEPAPTGLALLVFVLASSAAAIVASSVMMGLIERPTMDAEWPQKLGRFIRRRLPVSQPLAMPPAQAAADPPLVVTRRAEPLRDSAGSAGVETATRESR